jgi:pimeloyl-ACP methyl ester carboxylesterase
MDNEHLAEEGTASLKSVPLPPAAVEQIQEPYRHGGAGQARDGYLFARSWGFDPRDIAVPTFLWHGEQDHRVPSAFARHLADAIPNCRATYYPNEGHFLFNKHAREILGALVPSTVAAAIAAPSPESPAAP